MKPDPTNPRIQREEMLVHSNQDIATATSCPKCGSLFDMPGQSFCTMCGWVEDAYQAGKGPTVEDDTAKPSGPFDGFPEVGFPAGVTLAGCPPAPAPDPYQEYLAVPVHRWPHILSTLYGIASAFGVSLAALIEANPIYRDRPDMVHMGAIIQVPMPSRPAAVPNSGEHYETAYAAMVGPIEHDHPGYEKRPGQCHGPGCQEAGLMYCPRCGQEVCLAHSRAGFCLFCLDAPKKIHLQVIPL